MLQGRCGEERRPFYYIKAFVRCALVHWYTWSQAIIEFLIMYVGIIGLHTKLQKMYYPVYRRAFSIYSWTTWISISFMHHGLSEKQQV